MLVRAAVSVREAALRNRVLARLRELSVWSDPLDPTRVEPEALAGTYDLIFTGPGFDPEQIAGLLQSTSDEDLPPAVVRLYREAAPEAQAHLLACGLAGSIWVDLDDEALLAALGTVVERRVRELEAHLGQDDLQPKLRDFRSFEPPVRALRDAARRAAGADSTLLLLGETGSGKEWLAHAIHGASPRASGPFVPVNCGALNETLLESELFGHEKGAFTGADRPRRGVFELAHGGTLFLDEIGEMPVHLQSRLLRVLEDRKVQRLGAEQSVKVDVRIIAATHRDLEQAVAGGRFRADLFYRLRVVQLRLPPLRERKADLPSLARYHALAVTRRLGLHDGGISERALDALSAYDWPGNVRELANIIERAIILRTGTSIELEDLPYEVSGRSTSFEPTPPLPALDGLDWERPWRLVRQDALDRAERTYFERLLTRCAGRIGRAAREAGLSERGLFEKMKRHGLLKENFRG